MASGYRHVTQEQRYTICAMRRAGMTQLAIAKALQVSPSTISRELSRNRGGRGYRHKQAQRRADQRQTYRTQHRKFTPAMQSMVEAQIRQNRSPEQIAGRCRHERIACVSPERIYQYIWQDKRDGGDLYKHLRSGRRLRRKRYGHTNSRGLIPNRRPISKRPKVVDARTRIGDWEADTMIGKQHQGALVTIVERKSKLTRIGRVVKKTAANVTQMCIQLLKPDRDQVLTITTDNGKEFADHRQLEHRLKARVYFADPYASWQRGTNENTNGLIRQYVPKSRPLYTISDKELEWIEDQLNNRPRKSLGFKTPNEVFYNHKRRVALRS